MSSEKQHILLLTTLYIRTSIENTKEPSPSLLSNENAANRSKKKDDSLVNEDPLKGLVPLGPLGLFSATRQPSHLPSDSRGRGGSAGTPQHSGGHTKPTHQLPFSSKIDQFCGNGGGGTTIAANATTLFQPHQGTLYTNILFKFVWYYRIFQDVGFHEFHISCKELCPIVKIVSSCLADCWLWLANRLIADSVWYWFLQKANTVKCLLLCNSFVCYMISNLIWHAKCGKVLSR